MPPPPVWISPVRPLSCELIDLSLSLSATRHSPVKTEAGLRRLLEHPGVCVWVTDARAKIKRSSNNIPESVNYKPICRQGVNCFGESCHLFLKFILFDIHILKLPFKQTTLTLTGLDFFVAATAGKKRESCSSSPWQLNIAQLLRHYSNHFPAFCL